MGHSALTHLHGLCHDRLACRLGRQISKRNSMSQTVEFFWEPGSPYTYLAATQVEKVAAANGGKVVWKPFLLGKVFEARGMKMPASIPAKASYMFKDLARWAQMYQVPVTM